MPKSLLLSGGAALDVDDELVVVEEVGDGPDGVGPNNDNEHGHEGVPAGEPVEGREARANGADLRVTGRGVVAGGVRFLSSTYAMRWPGKG